MCIRDSYKALLGELEHIVQRNLTTSEWLTGAQVGPVDVYALTLTRWGSIAGIDPATYPALWAHVQKVAAQPAVAVVIERERLQLNLFKPA